MEHVLGHVDVEEMYLDVDPENLPDKGEIVETANKQPIRKGKGERYKLTTADGKSVYRAIKPLYRRAFGKEYSLDLIEDLDGEEWKPIDRRGKYYISNRGRVKSF